MTGEQRRHPWRRYLVLLLILAAMLWFAVDDTALFVVLLPGLALLIGYREWAAGLFAPSAAQREARAGVLAGGAAIWAAFARDEDLRDSWIHAGVPMDRLLDLSPEAVAGAIEALRREPLPGRRLAGAAHTLNRAVAVGLGLAAGGTLARLLDEDDVASPPWWLWLLLAVVLVARAGSAALDRARIAWSADAMRADPGTELAALTGARQGAVVAELTRLSSFAPTRVVPEPRVLDLLLLAGALLGLIIGLTVLVGVANPAL